MNINRLFVAMALILGGFFAGTPKAAAQVVSGYSFSQSNGTYATLANPTVLVSASATTGAFNSGSYVDSVSLPFPFSFGGFQFTKCYVSTSGFIAFGPAPPPVFVSQPLSSVVPNAQGIVAAWGNAINPVTNFTSNGVSYNGTLSWATLGTAPNRKVVIQWKNFRPSFSTSSIAVYAFDFQIALEETSNKVSLMYGGVLGFLAGAVLLPAAHRWD